MSGCCVPRGFELFGEKTARRDLRRYRRRGLDKTAREIVRFLGRRGVEGDTLLEVGGGIGAIQVELLRGGVARAVVVEASEAYEEPARELLRESGLEARAERRTLDFAQEAESVESADLVVMHRVVCCYPDPERLVGAAAERARRYLVFTFPRYSWPTRLASRVPNLWFRIIGWGYRLYVHPPRAMIAAAERRGLRLVHEHRGLFWQLAALEASS